MHYGWWFVKQFYVLSRNLINCLWKLYAIIMFEKLTDFEMKLPSDDWNSHQLDANTNIVKSLQTKFYTMMLPKWLVKCFTVLLQSMEQGNRRFEREVFMTLNESLASWRLKTDWEVKEKAGNSWRYIISVHIAYHVWKGWRCIKVVQEWSESALLQLILIALQIKGWLRLGAHLHIMLFWATIILTKAYLVKSSIKNSPKLTCKWGIFEGLTLSHR